MFIVIVKKKVNKFPFHEYRFCSNIEKSHNTFIWCLYFLYDRFFSGGLCIEIRNNLNQHFKYVHFIQSAHT